jgi:hypothetical protein
MYMLYCSVLYYILWKEGVDGELKEREDPPVSST